MAEAINMLGHLTLICVCYLFHFHLHFEQVPTFAKPHQYATGVQHMFVNGTAVLHNGEHVHATPGQVVRGPETSS
ncbi:MAG: hypothetical protein GY805_05420 [Chloroflexi bacterium]|nr:hypothetical protein [Chloroflexota bacterium]